MTHTTAHAAPTVARRRSIRILAALTAVAAIGVLTLAPRAIVAPARGMFMRFIDAATSPVLVWIPYGDAEQILNTMLFVPLGATSALVLARRAWPVAMLGAFTLSAVVEYEQRSIPGRVPDPADVFWNTLGGVIGVMIVSVPRLMAAAITRAGQRERVTSA